MRRDLLERRAAERSLSLKVTAESSGAVDRAEIGFVQAIPKTTQMILMKDVASEYSRQIARIVDSLAYVVRGEREGEETDFKNALINQLGPQPLGEGRIGFAWPGALHEFEHEGRKYEIAIDPRYGRAVLKRSEEH